MPLTDQQSERKLLLTQEYSSPRTIRFDEDQAGSPLIVMRIAVLEAVCAGLCGDNPSPSLLAEGLAMCRALVEDLLVIPDVTIETVVDDRWFSMMPPSPRLHAWRVTDVAETMMCWENCLEDTDAAWIIAPECDVMLERLVTAIPSRHVTFNATPEAIRLCTDKLALAQHLEQHGISTIPTSLETWDSPPVFEGESFVIKPRDGAGSQLVRIVDDHETWERTRREYQAHRHVEAIRQPLVKGLPLSIAGWFHAGGVQWFPVAQQRLGEDFAYFGGVIPAQLTDRDSSVIQQLVAAAAATIPGLRGYIGFDVILPLATSDADPVLVEINPRMTTSSIGYRRLCAEPWLERLIKEPARVLNWRSDVEIHFTADGVCREIASS